VEDGKTKGANHGESVKDEKMLVKEKAVGQTGERYSWPRGKKNGGRNKS